MRKLSILSIFFLFFLLFLNGCGNFKEKDNDYFEKKQDFSISANCKQNASEYKMKIEKNDYMSRPGENIEATTEYGDYQAKIDKKSGLPKMLKLKNQNFSCSFD